MLKQRYPLILFALLALLSLGGCSPSGGTGTGGSGSTTPTVAATHTATTGTTPTATGTTSAPSGTFSVSSIDMAVNPTSIAGMSCGTAVTVTYTATFHVPAGSAGGTVQFFYSINNGRGQAPASLTFAPGETTKTYQFTWAGNLTSDNVYPGVGIVLVTAPNHLISPPVRPTGTCNTSPTSAFHVDSVDMAVNPTSIAGIPCGTYKVVTYTATFHITPNGPGGTIHFNYSTNNGRGQSEATLTVAPGETTKTYQFTWSGNLPADHVYPENGIIEVESPNNLISHEAAPSGQCS